MACKLLRCICKGKGIETMRAINNLLKNTGARRVSHPLDRVQEVSHE